jgi:hypothetical protein
MMGLEVEAVAILRLGLMYPYPWVVLVVMEQAIQYLEVLLPMLVEVAEEGIVRLEQREQVE